MSEHPVVIDASKTAEKGAETTGSGSATVEIVDASAFGRDTGKTDQVAAKSDANNGLSFTEDDTPKEIGGRDGPEPTRFGDWEKNGRCIDF